VERELLLDPLLECLAFFEGEGIGLGDDGNNVDNIRELLQNDDINGLEATLEVNWVSAGYLVDGLSGKEDSRMTRWLDKEQAAVDTGILDVTLTLSSEFLAEVGRVLILDILDNGVPAGLVVSLHSYF
jgi:hypothetical protein